MAPSSHPAYAKDERVLCFHHELLYEAKVLESKLSDSADKKSPLQYLIHYKGWKNTYVKLLSSHLRLDTLALFYLRIFGELER